MTTRLVILSGLLLCGSLASGKNELSFKETVVPVKVAPDQDSITCGLPLGIVKISWNRNYGTCNSLSQIAPRFICQLLQHH